MTAHTPEPWYAAHHNFIYAADHLLVGQTSCPPALSDNPVATQAVNADRIVLCVNACSGKTDAELQGHLFTEGELKFAVQLARKKAWQQALAIQRDADAFAAAVWQACDDLFITPEEAVDAIEKFKADMHKEPEA